MRDALNKAPMGTMLRNQLRKEEALVSSCSSTSLPSQSKLDVPVPGHLHLGKPIEEVSEAEKETRSDSRVDEVEGRKKNGAAWTLSR